MKRLYNIYTAFGFPLFICLTMPACKTGNSQVGLSAWKVTVVVVDQDGVPVEDAKVSVGWWSLAGPGQDTVRGLSNQDGIYSARGRSGRLLTLYVEKEGYYWWRMNNFEFETTRLNRWMPWNPTVEVELKEVRDPIPMYVHRVEVLQPDVEDPVGFDLKEGDWVSPHGKGEVSDFIFHIEGENVDGLWDSTLTLEFTNEGDGLIHFKHDGDGSRLLSAHKAPKSGYEPIRQWRWLKPGYLKENIRDYDTSNHYYFRVRTELDSTGKVVSAWYGKIYNDIMHGPHATEHGGPIRFLYYLNPEGNRNVEFNPQENLFPPEVGVQRGILGP